MGLEGERAIKNKKSQKEKRKKLRKQQTKPEQLLWNELRNRKFLNLKFRRQYGIGEYVVDFYCAELKLAIEIDGDSHFTEDAKEYDEIRTRYINTLGIKVIRFSNEEVLESIDEVLWRIGSFRPHPPAPSPSLGEGE